MKKLYCGLILFFISPPLFADNIIDRIQQLEGSIVAIHTELIKDLKAPNNPNKKSAIYTRNAAGIIIDPTGIIVTNTHTIINAPIIWVTLTNGSRYQASLLSARVDDDFSLIKIKPDQPLQAVELANSNSANLGEPIIAIGNSEFNQRTLLSGEIKTLLTNKQNGNVEFIAINLNLYRGDSGGPVFDRNGRLLGMVMAKLKTENASTFIIPANKIREQYWHDKQNMP